MKSKFTKMMNISFITSALFIVLGVSTFIFKNPEIEKFAYVVAGIFILNGGANIIDDYSVFKPFYFFDGFTSGLLSIILGVTIVLNTELFTKASTNSGNTYMVVLPIAVGLWFIISSTFKLRMSLALKDTNNNAWLPTYILALLTIVLGLYLIINPSIGTISIIKLGIPFIIFAIFDIIEVYIFKKNIKAIIRVFE